METGDRPNILFIMTDQLSTTMVSCTGNAYLILPPLTAWQHRGCASNCQSQKGRNAQFFVNYLPDKEEITIDMTALQDVALHYNASDANGKKQKKVI